MKVRQLGTEWVFSLFDRKELCPSLVDESPLVDESSISLYELSMVVARNNSSMLLESSCSEVENRKDEIDLPRGNFHFPRSGRPAKV